MEIYLVYTLMIIIGSSDGFVGVRNFECLFLSWNWGNRAENSRIYHAGMWNMTSVKTPGCLSSRSQVGWKFHVCRTCMNILYWYLTNVLFTAHYFMLANWKFYKMLLSLTVKSIIIICCNLFYFQLVCRIEILNKHRMLS